MLLHFHPLRSRNSIQESFSEVLLPVHPPPSGHSGLGLDLCTPSLDSPGLVGVCGCGEEALAGTTLQNQHGVLWDAGVGRDGTWSLQNLFVGTSEGKGAGGGHLPTSLVPRSVDADFRACLLLRFPCFIPVCPLKENKGTVSPQGTLWLHGGCRGAREGTQGPAVPGVLCSWAGCGAVAGDTGTGCTAEVGPAASTSHHLHEEVGSLWGSQENPTAFPALGCPHMPSPYLVLGPWAGGTV